MKRIISWIIAAVVIVFGVLGYLLNPLLDNQYLRKKIKDTKEEAAKIKDKEKEYLKRQEKRAKQYGQIKDREERAQNKFRNLFPLLVLFIFIVFSGFAYAADEIPAEPPPPSTTYEGLLKEYNETWDLLIEYMGMYYDMEQLYLEAEQDNKEKDKDLENLQNLLDTKDDIIKDLIKELNRRKIGLMVGIDYKPLKAEESGIIIGATYNF